MVSDFKNVAESAEIANQAVSEMVSQIRKNTDVSIKTNKKTKKDEIKKL